MRRTSRATIKGYFTVKNRELRSVQRELPYLPGPWLLHRSFWSGWLSSSRQTGSFIAATLIQQVWLWEVHLPSSMWVHVIWTNLGLSSEPVGSVEEYSTLAQPCVWKIHVLKKEEVKNAASTFHIGRGAVAASLPQIASRSQAEPWDHDVEIFFFFFTSSVGETAGKLKKKKGPKKTRH